MKKHLLICTVISFVLIILSGCEYELVDYSTGAMNYQLPDNYTKEKMQITADRNYNDTLDFSDEDSDYVTAEDFLALDWYDNKYSDDDSITVTALAVPYNNDEFDKMFQEAIVTKGDYKTLSAGGATGNYGVSRDEEKDFTNTMIRLLKDGIYYKIVFFNEENMDEEELSAIISSISFDSNNLKKRVVSFEDITLEIYGLYQDLTVDPDDSYLSKEAYRVYGDYDTELELLCSEMENGVTIEDYAEYFKEEFQNGSYSEVMESFGKCYYYSGKLDNSMMAFALFELDGKQYMIGLSNEADAEISISEVQDIIKTIQLTKTNA